MEWLLPVVGLAVGLLLALLRARGAGRRRRRLAAGGDASTRALLGGATGRLHRGRLHLTGDAVDWSGRGRRVVLTGARVLAVSDRAPLGAQPGDVVVRLRRTDGGGDARLVLHEADAALLLSRLVSRSAQGSAATGTARARLGPAAELPPRAPRRRWPLVLLGLAAVWLLCWAYLVVGGRTVAAVVSAPLGDGTCDVAWTGADGQPRRSTVDCADDPAGTRRAVWELAPPFTSEAADPAWTTGSVLVLALLAALPAAGGLLADRRDRRSAAQEAVSAGPGGQPSGDVLPALTPADVARTFEAPPAVLARFAPHAHRQVPSTGWQHPRRPAGAGAPSLLRDLPRSLLRPALGLGLVLLLTAPAPWRWWQLATTGTAPATATSTGVVVVDGPAFVPDEVTVTYRDAAGATRRADVATTRALPEGEQLRITRSTARPGWARVDGPGDGLPRDLLLAGAGALLALGAAAVSASRVVLARTRVGSAAAAAARPALATLTGAPDGQPVLLVCDPLSQPADVLAVPLLAPLPHGAARAFPADRALAVRARGGLREARTVVVDVPGVGVLVPAGPAWTPDGEELLALLDAEAAFSGLSDGDDEDDEDDGDDGTPART